MVRAKRKVARAINSGALMADSKQTELCTYLSAILLGGLLLNALFGWWWADPVAALWSPLLSKRELKRCAVKLAVMKELPLMLNPQNTYIALLAVQALHLGKPGIAPSTRLRL